MHAGVDDEAHGAPHVVGQCAEPGVGVLVKAEVVAEALAVEPPALDEGREAHVAAEVRHVAEFLLQSDLEVMARHSLVHR